MASANSTLRHRGPVSEARDELRVITAGTAAKDYWKDLWNYRQLFLILAWRDVAVRYKQTVIGIAWAVVRPVITMVVFTVIFGGLIGLPSDGDAPYALMVFAAMLPWNMFASALTSSAGSVVGNASLIGKVYFPRLIVPGATLLVATIDFLIGFVVLLVLMAVLRYPPTPNMLAVPGLLILAILAGLGPGLLLSALNVKYRDFAVIAPFITQLGLFISPVGFSSNLVPERWFLLYSLNPMVGVIDGFRWAILGDASAFRPTALIAGLIVSLLLVWAGLWRFRAMERTFADVI